MPWRQAVVILCLVVPAISNAEMYTWTDSEGVQHFSDIKPQGREHERVELKPLSSIPMRENITRGKRVTTINQQVTRSLEASNSARPTGADKQKVRERHRKKVRCRGYRERLELIQQKLRAGYSNDKGNGLRRQRRQVSQKLSRECLLS